MAFTPYVSGLVVALSLVSASAMAGLPFNHLYVLGDSVSDQGNLFAATQVLGPALAQPAIPTADHYYQGRFSNGETYAGQLAQKWSIELKPSSAGGTNFAYGGARSYYNRLEIPRGPYAIGAYPWSLDQQRQAFLNQAVSQGVDPKGLYIVFSGSNDLSDILELQADPVKTIQDAVTGNISTVETFKAVGAQTILVPNLPDIGVSPSVARFGPGAVAYAGLLSRQFNAAQDAALKNIKGINLIRFDSLSFLNDVIANPKKYHFKNVSQACFSGFVWPDANSTECSKPDDYLFWDIEHPSRKMHALLAQKMYESVMQCQAFSLFQNWLQGKSIKVDAYTRCSYR